MSGGLYLGSVSLTGGASNLNVNINASNGNPITAEMGVLSVADATLDACIADNKVAVDVQSSVPIQVQALVDAVSTSLTATSLNSGAEIALNVLQSRLAQRSNIWFDATFSATENGGLGKSYPLPAIEVGAIGLKQISIFGNVSALAGGTTPLNLTIVYSQDGTTWFNTSFGSINFTTAGDFSRDWTTSASYVSIYADTAATATLNYAVSM
jgi:hypothetical protein